MNKPANNLLPYVASFIAGLAICLLITMISGRKEAWDAPEYFTLGIPVMCLAIIAMTVVSLPQFIVALIASRIARKRAPPAA
jgi:hypothetical protein